LSCLLTFTFIEQNYVPLLSDITDRSSILLWVIVSKYNLLFHWFIITGLYVSSVQYVFYPLFVSLCYFPITRLTFLIFFLYLFSWFVRLFFSLHILCFYIVLWIVSPFLYSSHFLIFCTSFPTTVTRRKPNCSN
jgi:hypothetical protein